MGALSGSDRHSPERNPHTLERTPRSAAHPTAGRQRRFSDAAAFWIVAASFLIAMAFTVVPTPLWTVYEQRDGFNTLMVTVAFAIYAVGVLVSLFLAGHISDWLGRRTILLPAILIEALSAVLFIFWNDLPGILVARVISGFGIGMITATATAHISELHSRAHPDRRGSRAQIVSTAANIGGFAVGVLLSSLLVQFAPAPIVTPYAVFLGLLLLAAIGMVFVPETVERPARLPRYHPQRIKIPESARGEYFSAAGLAFAGLAVLGLFTAIAPVFVAGELHITSHLVGGLVVFATFASAAGLQIGVGRLSRRTAILIGVVLYILGFASIVVGVELVSLALFIVGGVLAGGAAGILFSSAIGAGGSLARAKERGEALAGIFLAGYIGLAVPVVGIGAATLAISLPIAIIGFSILVVAIAVIAATIFLKRTASSRRA
jgi:MFS family permease